MSWPGTRFTNSKEAVDENESASGKAAEPQITKEKSDVKRILTIATFCSLAGLSAWAAPQTLTGQISDSMCGKSHAGMGEMGKNPKECTAGCVKTGAKYVFVSGDKIYEIQNQSFAALAANAGGTIQLTGDVDKDGKTITVTKIAPAAK